MTLIAGDVISTGTPAGVASDSVLRLICGWANIVELGIEGLGARNNGWWAAQ